MKNALIILLLTVSTVGFSQGVIEINMTNLSNDSGQVIVLLFKQEQAFGADKEPYRKIINDKIRKGKCSITISGIESGEYAFIVFHDEDKNGELLTNFMGMPKEGIGNSGAKNQRPTYSNTKFVLKEEIKIFNITLRYL
jgi:uncharacterized protein (DUF2141 family)